MKKQFRIINPNFTGNDFYSNEYVLGHFPTYQVFLVVGSRGRGKTYSGKNLILNRFNNRAEGEWVWIRLNEEPVQNMLTNDGATFFEPSLLRKKKIQVKTSNNNVFFTKSRKINKDTKWTKTGQMLSLQKYADWKGNDFENVNLIIIDELVRAETQKKTFDVPSAFINTIENLVREREDIMVLIYTNTIGEMAEIRDLFGFLPMPGNYGVFKLPHKRTIIEYLDDSKEWKRRKKKTLAGILLGNRQMAEFSNVNSVLQSSQKEIWPRSKIKGKIFLFNFLLARNYVVSVYSINDSLWIDWVKYSDIKHQAETTFSIHQQLIGGGVIFNKEVRDNVRKALHNDKIRYSDYTLKQDFFRYAVTYKLI